MSNTRFNRLPFAPDYLFVATRQFILNGRDYAPGDELETAGVSIHRLRQLYDIRKITISLDDEGNPRVRIAKSEPELEGHLAGVVDADGNVVELADMPAEQLQAIAADMGIEGAEQFNAAELADAIGAEPVTIPAEQAEEAPHEAPQEAPHEPSQEAEQEGTNEAAGEAPVTIPPVAPRYHAEHRGAGRWYVVDSTTSEAVTEPLKKDEALAKAAELNG